MSVETRIFGLMLAVCLGGTTAAHAQTAAATLSEQRAARAADINFWLDEYTGAERRIGAMQCPIPELDGLLREDWDIRIKSREIDAWTACFNAFVSHVHSLLPAEQVIPTDVLALMTEEEATLAKRNVYVAFRKAANEAVAAAEAMKARRDAWNALENQFLQKRAETYANRTEGIMHMVRRMQGVR